MFIRTVKSLTRQRTSKKHRYSPMNKIINNPKQNYYTNLGKEVPHISARVLSIPAGSMPFVDPDPMLNNVDIDEKYSGRFDFSEIFEKLHGGYALQLDVPNQYLIMLKSNAKQLYHKSLPNRDEKTTWNTMLFIEKSGRLHLSPYLYISDELVQRYQNNSRSYSIASGAAYSTSLVHRRGWIYSAFHSDLYFPSLLFAVPDDIWNEFINKLPDQNVVSNLNLSEHRHLWVAYNYSSRSDALINQYRSQAIGQYHFLASIVANASTNDDYLGWAYGTCNESNELASRCSQTAQRFYTDDLYSKSHYKKMEIDINYINVFREIDRGVKPNTLLTNRLPYLTPLFLNKFSQCPVWHQVHNIGLNMILPKVSDASGKVNKNQLDGFIANLPSSKKDPIAFAKMISDSQKMLTRHLSTNLSSAFFHHAIGNFGNFNLSEKELAEINDYIQALVKNLIFPEFIRVLQQLPIEQFKEMAIKDAHGGKLDNASNILNERTLLNEYLKNLSRMFEKILSSLDSNQLNKLQQRWHRNVAQIDTHKPVSPFRLEWHPLFDKQTIGTITFTCITKDTDLKKEGDEMHHCVGGYTSQCMTGESHVIQVVSKSGERSTLELTINAQTNTVAIKQNRGAYNKAPSEEINFATKQLLERLNNNIIKMNINRGSAVSKETSSAANEIYPYAFTDMDSQEAIYTAYKGNKDIPTKVLPACLMANSYREMLEKNNITTLIQDNLLTLMQVERNDRFLSREEIDRARKLV